MRCQTKSILMITTAATIKITNHGVVAVYCDDYDYDYDYDDDDDDDDDDDGSAPIDEK